MSFRIENQSLISLHPAHDTEVGRLPAGTSAALETAARYAVLSARKCSPSWPRPKARAWRARQFTRIRTISQEA